MVSVLACENSQGKAVAGKCDKHGRDEILQRAVALNGEKRYTEAADLLEGLLMQDPDLEKAIEQYNIALAGIDSLHGVGESGKNEARRRWQTSLGLQVRGGFSTNLNQAPTQPNIRLTLPTRSLTVELLPQFRKQSGFGMETQFVASADRTVFEKTQWLVRGEVFNRETGFNGYADYQGGNVLTSLVKQEEGGAENGMALGFNFLRYGADVYFYTLQMMLRHGGERFFYCKPQTGIDILWQRQHGNDLLDSRYGGVTAGFICDTQLGLYNLSASAGWDWASSQRPGGGQVRAKLQFSGIWSADAVLQNSFIKANIYFMRNSDMQAYSPWLNNGATRFIDRTGLEVDYDWPLDVVVKNWRGVVAFKWQDQNSNISLFEMDTLEAWLGVRTVW